MKSSREAALAAIYEIEYNGAYSNIILKNVLSETKLDSRDRAFVSALVYGVTAKKRVLDYMITELSSIKLKKISKYILIILRMGLYQLKFMDKIPDSAAVNESVRLARRYSHSASAGYVNGILRNAAKTSFALPEDLAVRESFADENAKRLIMDYGERAEHIMAALNNEPKMTIRVNTLKTTVNQLKKQLEAVECPYCPEGLYVKKLDTSSSAEYDNGLFTVQDAAPMVACKVLAPKKGDTVIDLCAAPGGKTTYLAELMGNNGNIYAFDIHSHRVALVRKNAKRLGIDIINAQEGDATVYNKEYKEVADKVLADVPCSGIGIARRKPELKYKTEVEELAGIQLAILTNGAKYLKKGGELVYSTCTLYRDENEKVIEKFLENNDGFELVSFAEYLPEGFSEDKAGIMTVLPDKTDCDGFFVAKLRRCV
ncbi:MAG: 16S rRNA (cytosine(967)-C(5))-methyltransferase RsmB [Eubacteriales bacterium]|nr:16S rRNA (cytosine(967)-C(5))-methyltransferase RsmB [Eubacteriales bacterium]